MKNNIRMYSKCLLVAILRTGLCLFFASVSVKSFGQANVAQGSGSGKSYYLSSVAGSDDNPGTMDKPWKTLALLSGKTFSPGDSIFFARGSSFAGTTSIKGNGTADRPIVISSYGEGPMPALSNPDFANNCGRIIEVHGSHVTIEKLFFHDSGVGDFRLQLAREQKKDGGPKVRKVWREGEGPQGIMGAVFLLKGADFAIVQDCEFTRVSFGIYTYAEHGLFTRNYLHDGVHRVDKGWGCVGIVLVGRHNEISYNRIVNFRTMPAAWGDGLGSDGGAIEFDTWMPKGDAYIHHNFSKNNDGFIEVDMGGPTDNVVVAYNVSDDWKTFLQIRNVHNWKIHNNTVVKGPWDGNGYNGVVWIDKTSDVTPYAIRNDVVIENNIFVTARTIVSSFSGSGIFGQNEELFDSQIQKTRNNIYWCYEGPTVVGKDLGEGDRIADPQFVDFEKRDLRLRSGSPAIGAGRSLGYTSDILGNPILGANPDLGAYESVDLLGAKPLSLFNGKDLSGWSVIGDDASGKALWTVRDGAIGFEGGAATSLRSMGKYRDFRLTMEWRWGGEPGEGGVLVRAGGENQRLPSSLEVRIQDQNSGDIVAHEISFTGAEALQGAAGGKKKMYPSTENPRTGQKWNKFEIICQADMVLVYVNSVLQNRITGVPEREGYLVLTGSGSPLLFRKIELMPLR